MDISTLAATAVELLAKAMPYLVKGGEKAAEKAEKELGRETWEQAKGLWGKLAPATEKTPLAAYAAAELAEAPDDEDARASLRLQLRKLLKADSSLVEAVRAVVSGAGIAVAGGQVAVGHDVKGNVIVVNGVVGAQDAEQLWRAIRGETPPDEDLEAATRAFLKLLVDLYRYLDFRGMGISERVPLKLPLLEMYIPLDARVEMPEGETWSRDLHLAGRAPSDEEAEVIGELSEPRPALHLLAENDGLIILGDPGAGKTTFLKFLALTLATGQGKALGLGNRLPVLVPLFAYANALREGDLPLERFIDRHYRDRGVSLPVREMLAEALRVGGVVMLLDGLDEVKETRHRHLVVDRVSDSYSFHRGAGNKFVLYQPRRWLP